MTSMILTFLYYWGLASGIATGIVLLWAWRRISIQNAEEKLRASLGYRANVKGWKSPHANRWV